MEQVKIRQTGLYMVSAQVNNAEDDNSLIISVDNKVFSETMGSHLISITKNVIVELLHGQVITAHSRHAHTSITMSCALHAGAYDV